MKLKKIFAVVLALGALVLVGCKQEDDSETKTETAVVYSYILPVQGGDLIVGTWKGQYPGESYEIAPEQFKSSGSYEGSTTFIRYTSETSGYIYFKYTNALKSLDAEPWYEYSVEAPDVGKWYCVFFKNLKPNSVYLSGAWRTGGKSSTETLEEAVKEFTIDNGYFNGGSECTKSAS